MSLPVRCLVMAAISLTPAIAAEPATITPAMPVHGAQALPDLVGWHDHLASDVSTNPGATVLRLAPRTINIGAGPMELQRGMNPNPSGSLDGYQRIYDTLGGSDVSSAGILVPYPDGSYRLQEFELYRVRAVLADDGVGDVLISATVDALLMDSWPRVSGDHSGVYGRNQDRQGVSVGWVTGHEVVSIDVTDLPSGSYWIERVIDPADRLRESDESNNVSRVKIAHVNPLGSVSGRVYHDTNGDGADSGEPGLQGMLVWAASHSLSGPLPLIRTVNAASVPQELDDLRLTTSFMAVDAFGLRIADVNVKIDLSHTYDSDLRACLVSPTGRRVELFSHVGGSGDGFTATTFDDAADTAITAGSAPFSGTYRPVGSLASLNGVDPVGTWRLLVFDEAGADVGTINSWSLDFTLQEPSAVTDADGRYIITRLASGDRFIHHRHPNWDWRQTTPGPYHLVTLGLGQVMDRVRIDFGNRPISTVDGRLFEDVQLNGIKDDGDPALPGWTIFADSDNDGAHDISTIRRRAGEDLPMQMSEARSVSHLTIAGINGGITDVDVRLSLANFDVRNVAVYITSPRGQRVRLLGGRGHGNEDAEFIDVTFDDTGFHSDGFGSSPVTGSFLPDEIGELRDMRFGSPNGIWTLELINHAYPAPSNAKLLDWSVILTCAEPWTRSGSDGGFSISRPFLDDGVHVIRPILKPDWHLSASSAFFLSVSLSEGASARGNDFGVYRLGSVSGTVYEDRDGDGDRDDDEPGLMGRTVFADEDSDGVRHFGTERRQAFDLPRAIPDLDSATSSITVEGLLGAITDLNVEVGILHNHGVDLDAYLIAPNGRRIELFRGVGGAENDFIDTILDDEATMPIVAGSAPFRGTYRPAGGLSAIDGITPNGIWRLEVVDTIAGVGGTLTSWSITFDHSEIAATTSPSGTYTLPHLRPVHYRIREVLPPGYRFTAPATYPEAAFHGLLLGTGQTLTYRDFGNWLLPLGSG